AVEPKTQAGKRTVPIASVLREFLIRHRFLTGRSQGFVFGSRADRPFTPSAVRRRAATAWQNSSKRRGADGLSVLTPIGLHECRHTFASLMIAAGVNAKALSTYMGHSSVTITLDRYGHLMPGNEQEAAGLLDSYLESTSAA